MSILEDLENEAKQAQRELWAAEEKLAKAREKLNTALRDKSLPVLERWQVWARKNDFSNKNPEYIGHQKTLPGWKKLRNAIMTANGLDRYTGARWDWIETVGEYLADSTFKDAPLPDTEMVNALEAIMHYDAREFILRPSYDL